MPKTERQMVLALIRAFKHDGIWTEARKWEKYYERLKTKPRK